MIRTVRLGFLALLPLVATLLASGCADQSPMGQPPTDKVVWRVRSDGTGDFSDIQAAVDASTAGDTILVGPGHYSATLGRTVAGIPRVANLIVDLGPSAGTLTIVSEAGPDSTVIGDSNLTDFAIIFNNITAATLSGFEIRGGGNNGLFLLNSNVTVSGNRITGAAWGLRCEGGRTIVRANAFVGNDVGLYAWGARLTTDGNRFEGNRQSGLFCANHSTATIHADTLMGNGTTGLTESADLRVSDSDATADGLFLVAGHADGALVRTSRLTLTGSTIAEHVNGDGVRLKGGASLTGERVIIATTNGCAVNTAGGTATMSCCDIWQERLGSAETSCAVLVGNGNTYQNPLFCNPAAGNYALSALSPCAPANSGGCGLIGLFGVSCP